MTVNDKNIAVIRTAVPVFIGGLLTLLARWIADRWGYTWDLSGFGTWLAPVLVALVTGVYYKAVRFLEAKKQSWGWLLGYPAVPTYTKAIDDVVAAGETALGIDPAAPTS